MNQEQLDPQSTALVLIDLENGIVERPLAPHSATEVVARSVQLANALRNAGGTVVYVRVLMHETMARNTDAPLRPANAPLPAPAASELVAELEIQPQDLVVIKRSWGAFYGTELDQLLRRRGIRTILLGGIATNFGVESTGRAAFDRGYELIFVHDAMTSFNTDAHNFAVQNIFPRCGRTRSLDETLHMLPSPRT
jgi:nicotinamidase-related amidase